MCWLDWRTRPLAGRTLHSGVLCGMYYLCQIEFVALELLLPVQSAQQDGVGERTYCRLGGHSMASFRLYSGPSTWLFRRWSTLRCSRVALNSAALSLLRVSGKQAIGNPEHTVWCNVDNTVEIGQVCNRLSRIWHRGKLVDAYVSRLQLMSSLPSPATIHQRLIVVVSHLVAMHVVR